MYLGILTAVRRAVLKDTIGLIGDAVRSGLGRERGFAPAGEAG
jgi:hypothetical protein